MPRFTVEEHNQFYAIYDELNTGSIPSYRRFHKSPQHMATVMASRLNENPLNTLQTLTLTRPLNDLIAEKDVHPEVKAAAEELLTAMALYG